MSADKEFDGAGDFDAGLEAFLKGKNKPQETEPDPVDPADEEEEQEEEEAAPPDDKLARPDPNAEPVPGFSTWPKAVQDEYLKVTKERDEAATAKAELAAAKLKVDNDLKALHGRVAPDQARADRLEAALRDRDEKIKKFESQGQAKPPSDSKWAKLLANLPEEDREAFIERETARQAEVQELRQLITAQGGTVGEIRSKLIAQEQIETLDEAFPDWQTIVHSDAYGEWLMKQPKQVQSLADSLDAEDYKFLIGTFRANTQPPTPPSKTKEELIAEKRAAVAGKPAPSTRGSGAAPASASSDPDEDPNLAAYLRDRKKK